MFFIYAVSDSIGETCELVARGIACQFTEDLSIIRIPHISTIKKAEDFVRDLPEEGFIIISTIVLDDVEKRIRDFSVHNNIPFYSVLRPSINSIEDRLGVFSLKDPGRVWNSMDSDYFKKISAIEFAIHYDDSKDHNNLKDAELILIGLSRTSKTPLSMYLAYKGIKVINIPIIPEVPPPEALFKVDRKKIIALTIDPLKLIEIRRHRLERFGLTSYNSSYLNDERILQELDYADALIKKLACKCIDVTDRAIEDTALIVRKYLVSVGVLKE